MRNRTHKPLKIFDFILFERFYYLIASIKITFVSFVVKLKISLISLRFCIDFQLINHNREFHFTFPVLKRCQTIQLTYRNP